MQRAYRNRASETNRPGRTRRQRVRGSYIPSWAKEESARVQATNWAEFRPDRASRATRVHRHGRNRALP
jgi:hypothetical protein